MKDTASSTFTPERPKGSSPPDRRQRRSRSFSSTSSQSSSATTPSPMATPAHHLLSIIPFSWEHKPGVPKKPTHLPNSNPVESTDPLPPPPPIRSNASQPGPRRRRPMAAAADPFAAAMAECAKDPAGDGLDEFWKIGVGRRGPALGPRFGLVEMYGLCKTACSVADSTISIPRAAARPAGSYGLLLNRRAG